MLAESAGDGDAARYRLAGHESYVRVHAMSDDGAALWTQPIYDDAKLKRV